MKQQEIKQLSDADLKSRIGALEEKLMKMKVSHKITPIENPLQIRALRRTIARLLTELGKRVAQA
ncbi:MAG: 50S ribosomal protein L29 [Crocinitomicaceae bacterium]|jgi:large subunit ribosomal protein L29|nr:50S ribosomal protein L29 [Crocinitomicaceae bacterium]